MQVRGLCMRMHLSVRVCVLRASVRVCAYARGRVCAPLLWALIKPIRVTDTACVPTTIANIGSQYLIHLAIQFIAADLRRQCHEVQQLQ